MKFALPLWIGLLAISAHAQSGLDAQYPNAAAALNSVAFPLDLPAQTKTGEAVVEFTIGANGAITDATAAPSSDPAFARRRGGQDSRAGHRLALSERDA